MNDNDHRTSVSTPPQPLAAGEDQAVAAPLHLSSNAPSGAGEATAPPSDYLIPNELKALDRWVNWRCERRGDKDTKVPYCARTGKMASSTDPATWAAFDEACAVAGYDGVGFVFTKAAGIVGIDLDHCRNAETGEIEGWALDIVKRLNSYTEVSPSGTGLHIFIYGTLPPGPRRKGQIEMYDEGRYFTVTGQHLQGTLEQVMPRADELAELHQKVFAPKEQPKPQVLTAELVPVRLDDQAVLEKARKAKNGAAFDQLFAGGVSGYASQSEADLALCNKLAFWAGSDVAQMDRLFRQSGLMRDKWDRPLRAGGETYGQATIAKAVESAVEVYTPRQTVGLVRPATMPELIYFQHNDAGNAERLIAVCGDSLRYCHVMEKWFRFDGRRWIADDTDQSKKIMKVVMLEFHRQAQGNDTAEKFAKQSLNESRIKAALSSAECELPITPDQLDRDAYLLNCLNGTLDLRTGTLRPHRREDYITKLCHFDYNPLAECPLWLKFLYKIMGGHQDHQRAERLVSYLQKAFGSALTANVSEKAVFCLFGNGNNGKSTLLATFRHVIEEYSAVLQIETLMAHQQESNNSQADLADLRGARFVMTSETEEGQRLAVGKLKRITQGMGKIKAVRKYENPIEFAETHKLFMDANHKPVIPESEGAIWNRLKPIPFSVTIPKAEIDPELPEKLKAEAEGILAWAVAGCLRWQRERLGSIEEIDNAAEEWRAQASRFSEFLEDRCVLDVSNPNCWVPVSELWPAYQEWAKGNGESSPLNKQAFDDHLTRLDCEADRITYRGKRTRIWRGIRFRTSVDGGKVA